MRSQDFCSNFPWPNYLEYYGQLWADVTIHQIGRRYSARSFSVLTHCDRNHFYTTFSNVNWWLKTCCFDWNFVEGCSLRSIGFKLALFQLMACRRTCNSKFLNNWWLCSLIPLCVTLQFVAHIISRVVPVLPQRNDDNAFLHARPWIPGDEIAIFTAVIH